MLFIPRPNLSVNNPSVLRPATTIHINIIRPKIAYFLSLEIDNSVQSHKCLYVLVCASVRQLLDSSVVDCSTIMRLISYTYVTVM